MFTAQMCWTTMLLLASGAHAHGMLTIPASRNGGDLEDPSNYEASKWYTFPSRNPNGPTWNDDSLRTERRFDAGSNPWRAPGTANIWSPCGNYCSNCDSPNWDRDGRKLPQTEKTVWKVGTEVEVGWGMNTNHGGGSSYRLCKAGDNPEDLTEECFRNGALEFVGDMVWIQRRGDSGDRLATPAKRVKGAGGSHWTKNPVPQNGAFPTPHPGVEGHYSWCGGDYCDNSLPWMNIVDKVKIPADLAPGHYVLGWRWDCEETAQTWLNCADIDIQEPAPEPAPAAAPAAAPGVAQVAPGDSFGQLPAAPAAGYPAVTDSTPIVSPFRAAAPPGQVIILAAHGAGGSVIATLISSVIVALALHR